MKVTILGSGAYGISLAMMFNKNNCDVTLWEKFEKCAKELDETRINKKALPNITIPKNIKISSNLEESIKDSNLIVFAIPATFVNDTAKELAKYIKKNQHICIATKGIEQNTCLFINEVIEKHIKTKNIAVISGPSFAIDMANFVPIGLALATKNKKTAAILHQTLANETLKLRETDDIIGTEICGSIKNVIAIAAGIIYGMGLPESTQAMFITESLHDIKALIKALGGNGKTILSFAGFGDLLLTCTSTKSRNFNFGRLIGEEKTKEEIDNYINNNTIEGLYTLKSIHKLIKNKKVDIPIINLIYNIVFHNKKPAEIKRFLIEKI